MSNYITRVVSTSGHPLISPGLFSLSLFIHNFFFFVLKSLKLSSFSVLIDASLLISLRNYKQPDETHTLLQYEISPATCPRKGLFFHSFWLMDKESMFSCVLVALGPILSKWSKGSILATTPFLLPYKFPSPFCYPTDMSPQS